MSVRFPYLFNFAASFQGGGFKRLFEYARWFNQRGGAYFVVNARSEEILKKTFRANRYFPVNQRLYRRIFSDCEYLSQIEAAVGTPDFYYSFGIPIYARFGRVNWFHLSNVLPIHQWGSIPLPPRDRVKLAYLGWRIRQHYSTADVVSAESAWSLELIDLAEREKLFLSVNGSDDELQSMKSGRSEATEDVAIVVGTSPYKALDDSHRVFSALRNEHESLRLMIVGDRRYVPRSLLAQDGVRSLGLLDRHEVIERLRSARYYISTTLIENSYNAASEGAVLAEESYLSDIGPHRELLDGMRVGRVAISGVARELIHVRREDLSMIRLKSWDEVVGEMLERVDAEAR